MPKNTFSKYNIMRLLFSPDSTYLFYSVCYSLQLLRKLVTALCSCIVFISASSVPWPTQCCLAAAQDSALQQGTIIIISL